MTICPWLVFFFRFRPLTLSLSLVEQRLITLGVGRIRINIEKWIYYLWIRILWSWCPCVAIITSASSRTNTLNLRVSMLLNLVHQSITVPGVPINMWSVLFCPRATVKYQVEKSRQFLTSNMFWKVLCLFSLSANFHF